MKTEEFKAWLEAKYDDKFTVSSRISNCKRVEKYYGELDVQYRKDQCKSLIEELKYSAEDEREHRTPLHKVPIDGNIRNGSATFRNAVGLYVKFRNT